MADRRIWVTGFYRSPPGEATPQWILIHERYPATLEVLCGLRPMWWTGDLSQARFLLKRDAKAYAAQQFGALDWDGTNHAAVPGGRLWLVRP